MPDGEGGKGPLAGLQVVELATYVAAPSAGMALAQLGADVIRVDPLEGAHDRSRWPLSPEGTSLYWAGLNKGKRSLAVDLRSERGQRIVADLAVAGGVLLHNQAGRSWLDDDSLRRRRPDLIHVVLEGRRGGAPALDYTVNARTGIPYMTGAEDVEGVVNHVLPAWDLIAGGEARSAILAALLRRQRTGEGSYVTIALEDVAIAAITDLGWLPDADLTGESRPRLGTHVYGTYGDAFRTKDDRHVFVMAMTSRQWRALLEATGTGGAMNAVAEALGADLGSDAERFRARGVISALLAPWFRERTRDSALDALTAVGALAEPYLTMAELASEVGSTDGVVARVDHEGARGVLTSRGAARWHGAPPKTLRARRLGEDGREVLQELLGMSASDTAALEEQGVVRG